jgi:predicted amidohydrolase
LDQLARAQAELTARGIDLLNVAHAIGRNAVATFKQELVNSLVQDNLLHDLEQLRTALAATPLSADLRLLPEATLNWLCRHLDLSQYLQPGQELEVPTERLSQYDLQGPLPDAAKALVKLQVLTPGWKHQGQIVNCSRVTVAAPPPPESPC